MSNQLTRRDFAIRTAGIGLALGLAPAAALADAEQASRSETSPAVADPYSLVDPELLPVLKQFPAFDLSAEMVGKFRQLPGMPPLPVPAPQPVERHIPGPPGAPEVRLWVVDPAPLEKGKPLLLHMHGGAFMMTDPMLMPRLQGIATDCHCVVVSVDYRLAPETRYPGSLEDNYAALKWAHAHAAELGIDRSRIAVGGESAGGGHAASLAIHARDRNEVPIVFQLLIYPGLDDRTGSSHPAPPAIGHFMWNASANRLAWSSLLGVPAGSSKVPVAAVPARVASVAGLPPAWIGVGSLDLFVEEDMEYARRLVHAGVATELLVVRGAFHGFDLVVPDAEASKRFSASWKTALRKAFATGKAV
ncbi:MAG: alpha/beta hydrolase [Acidobacteriia bacterium]|nr:alpha/beta hydrolase [Terriglobia bacterium]MBZ5662955.1 alpha/beta hydrolase [Terriglobia bacterium]